MISQIPSSSAACFSLPPPTLILTTSEFASSFSIARHNPVFFTESGRWISSPGPLSLLFEVDSWSPGRDLRSGSLALSHSPSFSLNASDIGYPRKKAEPAYSFVGMHCIFDQCKAMDTVVKFGHMRSDLLAYGASDGTLTVCTVSESPSVIKQLIRHSKDVTDFDFSSSNQYIASSSMDKTVRIWEISKGLCICVLYGVASQLCVRFHPASIR